MSNVKRSLFSKIVPARWVWVLMLSLSAAVPMMADELEYGMITLGFMNSSTTVQDGIFGSAFPYEISYNGTYFPTLKSISMQEGFYIKMTANSAFPLLIHALDCILADSNRNTVFHSSGDVYSNGIKLPYLGEYATDWFIGRWEMGGAWELGPGLLGLGVNFNVPTFAVKNADQSGNQSLMCVDFGIQLQYAMTIPLPFDFGDFLETLRVNPSITYNWGFYNYPQGKPFNSFQFEVDTYLKLLSFMSLNVYFGYDYRYAPAYYSSDESYQTKSLNNFSVLVGLSFHNIPFFDSEIGDNSY